MAPKVALLHIIGFAIAWLVRATPQPEEFTAAIAADSAACSASGGPEGCDLHLLQLRAQGSESVIGDDGSHSAVKYESASAAEAPDLVGTEEQIGNREASSLAAKMPTQLGMSERPGDARTSDESVVEENRAPAALGVAQAAYAGEADAKEVLEVRSSADMAGAAPVESADAIRAPGGTGIVHTTGEGRCSAQDEALMKKMGGGSRAGSFPAEVAKCGTHAYKWFKFHSDAMAECIRRKSGIGANCASCFGGAGQYGFDHCKAQCVFGKWCSNRCLGCTSKSNVVTEHCVGLHIAVPQPDRC